MIGSWCLRFDSLCKAILALQIRGDQILCHSQPNITIPRLSPGCLGICINSFRPPKASLEIIFFQKFTTYWENLLEQLLACSFCIIIQSGLWHWRDHADCLVSHSHSPPSAYRVRGCLWSHTVQEGKLTSIPSNTIYWKKKKKDNLWNILRGTFYFVHNQIDGEHFTSEATKTQ